MQTNHFFGLITKTFVFSFLILLTSCNENETTIEFTVSMDRPNTNYFEVNMLCKEHSADSLVLKMPVWTPGYYRIMDHAKDVIGLTAKDNLGNELPVKKSSKNRWVIETKGVKEVSIDYNIYAFSVSVVDPYLDYGRGFISPPAVFMHIENKLDLPATVKIVPYKEWENVTTGLTPVEGAENTYYAKNFDVLYDSPILTGNHDLFNFYAEGLPHAIAVERTGNNDMEKFIEDFKLIVSATAELMGEIPYERYAVLIMDRGMGGLEHLNSMVVYSNSDFYPKGRAERNTGWMNFITHEYFHLFNIKTIRPYALGPFDYDKENYTNMLWVSEGMTVYYQYIIMNRAGLLEPQAMFDYISGNIRSYENIQGKLFQSATQSSFDTWMNFFYRNPNASNSTISYYNKGCALGLLLDLAIRYESENKRSLDDVMRRLYYEIHKSENRGFTDAEFRRFCEEAAGTDLSEIFDDYAAGTSDINYQKYLSYAGLKINTTPMSTNEAWIGARSRNENGHIVVTGIDYDSPAWNYGLGVNDRITEINGKEPGNRTLDVLLKEYNPGDTLKLKLTTRYIEREIKIVCSTAYNTDFKIEPVDNPDEGQSAIFNSWLLN